MTLSFTLIFFFEIVICYYHIILTASYGHIIYNFILTRLTLFLDAYTHKQLNTSSHHTTYSLVFPVCQSVSRLIEMGDFTPYDESNTRPTMSRCVNGGSFSPILREM